MTGLVGFISANDSVNGVVEAVQERAGVQVLCLGIRFGVDDFLGSEHNCGKLLLPLLVALSSDRVSLGHDPENLSNDGTSNGLVAVAVPSSPHALVRSWAGP